MTTSVLDLPEIDESQASKYLTHNQALAILDAYAGLLTHNMSSNADYTLSTAGIPAEWQYGTVRITDTGVVLSAAKNIVAPGNAKAYVFVNATAQTLTLKTPSGTGIAVATGKTAILRCDGTNIVRVTADT